MVNVDELFPLIDAFTNSAKTLKAGAVGSDDEVKFLTLLGLFEIAVGIEEAVFFGNGILVPTDDLFPFSAQRVQEAELRANAITVGPDVTDDANSLRLAYGFNDASNYGGLGFHL